MHLTNKGTNKGNMYMKFCDKTQPLFLETDPSGEGLELDYCRFEME